MTEKESAAKTGRNTDEEKVPVFLFKDNNKNKDDVFVSVNGQRVQRERGVEVMVPKYIKEVLDHSREQDMNTARMISMLEEEAQRG